jgi:hypothetical protein
MPTDVHASLDNGSTVSEMGLCQGCQTVCFQTKNTNLGKFSKALDGKLFVYFMAIWNIL